MYEGVLRAARTGRLAMCDTSAKHAKIVSNLVSSTSAWEALQRNGIDASPKNYETLYAYYNHIHPEVNRCLDPYLLTGLPLNAERLQEVYDEFLSTHTRSEAVDSSADAISEAAQKLVDDVTANHGTLTAYSAALGTLAGGLNERSTVEDLLKAMATLSLETSRASERNRALEQQLSASSLRIAKLRQNLIEVKQEVTTCPLTGIANRKAFEIKLRRALTQAKADMSSPLCLLMLDVDHFKRFNDTYGHRTGDHVLRLVARMLSDNIKGKDTAARYGGEEFAILLAGADLQAGTIVARQICERIANQRLVKRGTGEQIGQITLSIGVAQHRAGENGTSFVERADDALYEAKRTGRSRVCAAA